MTLLLTFITSAIRLGITFLLGSTGEIVTEKSGKPTCRSRTEHTADISAKSEHGIGTH